MHRIIAVVRPRHWLKNLFLYAAPLFAGTLFKTGNIPVAVLSFISFSLCASAGYILNDVLDYKNDRVHPTKRLRPIAAGLLQPVHAIILLSCLLAGAFMISISVSAYYWRYLAAYFMLQLLYSLIGKNIRLVDIVLVASGFVLRMLAGAEAFQVQASLWLFICLFLLSLVLAAGKRLSELYTLDNAAGDHRHTLRHYSRETLSFFLAVPSIMAFIFYCCYILWHARDLAFTTPLVAYGLYRYFRLAASGQGEPIHAILADMRLFMTVLVWLIFIIVMRYNVS